jgi:hypothetical protein
MLAVEIDLQTVTEAERRDLANVFLRAAWSATLAERHARSSWTC